MVAGMGSRSAEDVLNGFAAAGESFDDGGYVVKSADSGATVTKTTDVTDAWVAAVVDATKDTLGNLLTGAPVGLYVFGVVPLKAIAGTYRRFDAIYLSQTAEANGHVKNSNANSATRVGTYVGDDNLTVVDGDKIEVLLVRQ